jgi:DNA primase
VNLRCLDVARAALGEPLRQTGRELFFRCPNPRHDDEHPSLQVNETKNVWMCGPCGVSGNAWQLAAFIGGLDRDDKAGVVAWLKDPSRVMLV